MWTRALLIKLGLVTFARRAFRAEVPEILPKMLPLTVDQVVVWSGLLEIALGASLLLFSRRRKLLGIVLGTFFVAILPGNIAQWEHHRTAFGLNTDGKRFGRLLGQPVLIA